MKYFLSIVILGSASLSMGQSRSERYKSGTLLVPVLSDSQIYKRIDSLKRAVILADSRRRTDVYLNLFTDYLQVDQDSAFSYANLVYHQASLNADSLNMVIALNAKATVVKTQGDFSEAIKIFERALAMARRNGFQQQIKFLLNNLALAHTAIASYERALAYHFESLKLREESGRPVEVSTTLGNIGIIYSSLDDHEKSLFYSQRSYDVKLKNGVRYGLDRLLINIGWALINLGEIVKAEARLNEVFVICDTSACRPDVLREAYQAFGVVLFRQGKFDGAESYLKKSLQISLDGKGVILGDTNADVAASVFHWLAEVSEKRNRTEEAISYLNKSQALAKPAGFKKILLDNYLLYIKIYTDDKNYRAAFEYQNLYIHLNAEIVNANLLRKISQIQADYQERENTAKISTQEKIMAAQTESIRGQQLLNILIGVITILSFVLIGLLFKTNRRKQKVNEVLDQRVKDRTVELEKSQDALRQSQSERAMLLRRVSTDLLSSWATLNGLSSLATKDLPREQAAYFKEAEATAERIVTYVNKYSMQD